MAPSVQQIPEEVPSVLPEKIAAMVKDAPKVKRQIEVEGGKTDAKVT
jgi:taurine dioxygenase/sulfonate dioxygenase